MIKVLKKKNTILLTCQEKTNNCDLYITKYKKNKRDIGYLISIIRYDLEDFYGSPLIHIERNDNQGVEIVKAFEEEFLKGLEVFPDLYSIKSHADKLADIYSACCVDYHHFFTVAKNSYKNSLDVSVCGYKGHYGSINIQQVDQETENKINNLFLSLSKMAIEYKGNEYIFPKLIKGLDAFDKYYDNVYIQKKINKDIEQALHMKRLGLAKN